MLNSLKLPIQYQPDILADGFEATTLTFPDDDEGPVVATLVRKSAEHTTSKAVLYIHGFLDYFFQKDMALQFNQHGYDFYALDLRKYGRSLRPHQRAYHVKHLNDYDAEIEHALHIIWREGHQHVLLAGHSTGGLICSLYAARHAQHPLIKALWLNSPFYDFNLPKYKKKLLLPHMLKVAKIFPNLKIPSGFNALYASSLHQQFQGEWDFNLAWKKTRYPLIPLSFIRAIALAQQPIQRGLRLTMPTLVMHSSTSSQPKRWGEAAQTTDIILNVQDIAHHAAKLQGKVEIMAVDGALHDVILSKKPVREHAYQLLFTWLNQQNF